MLLNRLPRSSGFGTERINACIRMPWLSKMSRTVPISTMRRHTSPRHGRHLRNDPEVMVDEQHGELLAALYVLEQVEILQLDRHIERGRRLVSNQELRRTGQRHRTTTRWRMPPLN